MTKLHSDRPHITSTKNKCSIYHFQSEKKPRDLLLKYLVHRKWMYVIGTIFLLGTSSTQVFVARNLGWIIDFFTDKKIPVWYIKFSFEDVFFYLFISLIVARVILTISRMGWRVTMGRQTHHAAAGLRKSIWDHACYYEKENFFETFSKGKLMNASNSDINSARFLFGWTLVGLVDVIFLGVFTLWAMLLINPLMTIGAVIGLFFLPLFVKKLTDLEAKRFRKAQELLSSFNDLCSQVVATIRLQRMTQSERFWEGRLTDSAKDYRKERLSAVFTSLGYIPLMGGVSLISYVVLFSFGIYLIFNNQMSVGDFISMQALIFLLQDPLMELGFIISDFKKGMTSLDRINQIFSGKKDASLFIEGTEKEDDTDLVLYAKDIDFSFDGKRQIIEKFNLSLKHGERLGITGEIGTGKSILVNILSGLERKHEGIVKFFGKKFDNYSHNYLRQQIGIVSQKPFLFAASIRENVCMDKELSDDEIWKFLTMSGLEGDIEKFTNGLDTELGEWGINLSGGQKQRLTLARTLAKSPKLLFMDDCLSAVDTITEEKILSRLDEGLKDTTIIWVAHRKSTLKYCDRISEI